MWEQPVLARYFTRMADFSRVMIFDKRGMGMSDRAREVPTLEARMDDVRAVMDAAGSECAMLSGGGEGARMTALFAATYPERVSAVALVNPSARGLWSPDYPWAHTEAEWRRLLHDVADGWGTQEFSDRLLREQALGKTERHVSGGYSALGQELWRRNQGTQEKYAKYKYFDTPPSH